MTQGLGVSVSAYVPGSLSLLYDGWWHNNPAWADVGWGISSGSDSVLQGGGLFGERSYFGSTVLVWDNFQDNSNYVDRYTVNNLGMLAAREDSYFEFEIGLWENDQDGAMPSAYDFGNLNTISAYYPSVLGMSAGADSIRDYMKFHGVLDDGSDEYWAHTYDAVLLMRDGSNAAFMVGINFDRNGPGPDPVPEPGAMLLLGFGLLGVSWVARRKR